MAPFKQNGVPFVKVNWCSVKALPIVQWLLLIREVTEKTIRRYVCGKNKNKPGENVEKDTFIWGQTRNVYLRTIKDNRKWLSHFKRGSGRYWKNSAVYG